MTPHSLAFGQCPFLLLGASTEAEECPAASLEINGMSARIPRLET